MKRRKLFQSGAVLAAGSAFALPVLGKKQERKLRIGACDWSIGKRLDTDAFRFGRELGLDGLQVSFGAQDDGTDLRKAEDREKLRQAAKESGLAVASLAIGLLNKIAFSNTDEGEQLVVECIEAMARLKEEAARLDDAEFASRVAPERVLVAFFSAGDINGKPELMESTIEKLKRVAPMAEKHGVTLALETWLNESDHRHILESVASPAVKVYYDVANANKMGYDIYKEIASLGTENICEIHCKENGFLLGEGRIDFPRLKGVIDGIGYDGWLIIESAVPKGMKVEPAYRKNVDYLHSVFRD